MKEIIALRFHKPYSGVKSLKIAVDLQGVAEAAVRGEWRDHIEVHCEGIDGVQLVKGLSNKIASAEIISITPVGDPEEDAEVEIPTPPPVVGPSEMRDPSSLTTQGQGQEIDAVELVKRLGKKVGSAEIISITPAEEPEMGRLNGLFTDQHNYYQVNEMRDTRLSLTSVVQAVQVVKRLSKKIGTAEIISVSPVVVGDNQDMEEKIEPETDNGVYHHQDEVYEMRDITTQYNDPYGKTNFYIVSD